MKKVRLSTVNFIGKRWSKSFNNGIAYIRVGFRCICAFFSNENTELFYKLFTRATESGRQTGGCNFRNILPVNVPKSHGGKIYVFDKKFSNSSESYYMEPGLYPYITDFVEAMNSLIKERHNHSENCILVKVSWGTQKGDIYLAKEGSGLAFFSTDLGHIFGSNVGNEFGVNLIKVVDAKCCCLWVFVQFSENYEPTSIKEETIFTFKTLLHKI